MPNPLNIWRVFSNARFASDRFPNVGGLLGQQVDRKPAFQVPTRCKQKNNKSMRLHNKNDPIEIRRFHFRGLDASQFSTLVSRDEKDPNFGHLNFFLVSQIWHVHAWRMSCTISSSLLFTEMAQTDPKPTKSKKIRFFGPGFPNGENNIFKSLV